MRIALELDGTECQALIDCLNENIQRFEEYLDTHEDDWNALDDVVLDYKVKLRDKIQKFQDIQEHLSIERQDKQMEDKQSICDALTKALRLTRTFEDLGYLGYDDKSETVLVKFENGGTKRIGVGLDSGYAMIKDIVNHIAG